MNEYICICKSVEETINLGKNIGKNLKGGEVIELISDLGGGKTTFVRGLSEGFGSTDSVFSPSFTISNVYQAGSKKQMHHFDFYRLNEAGIVGSELDEVIGDPDIVVVVEWGDIVHNILPDNKVQIFIKNIDEQKRSFTVKLNNDSEYIIQDIQQLKSTATV